MIPPYAVKWRSSVSGLPGDARRLFRRAHPRSGSHCAVDKGDDLRARAPFVRTEGRGGGALCNAFLDCPENGIHVVVRCDVRERVIAIAGIRLALTAPKEGDDLRAGAVFVLAEGGGAGTIGDLVFHGPEHGLFIVAAGLYVPERHIGRFRFGLTRCAPQEGHGVRTGAGALGLKMRRIHAGGNAVCHRPKHRVIVVCSLGNVDEGIGRLCFHLRKNRLDGMVGRDVLEGVRRHRAHIRSVYQHLGDGIAAVRLDGEGLIRAGFDRDTAGGRDRAVGTCLCR